MVQFRELSISQRFSINGDPFIKVRANAAVSLEGSGNMCYCSSDTYVDTHGPERNRYVKFKDVKIGNRFLYEDKEYVKTARAASTIYEPAVPVFTAVDNVPLDANVYVLTGSVTPCTEPKKTFLPDDFGRGGELYGDGSLSANVGDAGRNYYDQGNWRATEKGAEKLRDYRAALQRVREWKYDNCAEVDIATPYERSWVIMYHVDKDQFQAHIQSSHIHPNVIGYFICRTDLLRCLDACHDDLKIIFGIN